MGNTALLKVTTTPTALLTAAGDVTVRTLALANLGATFAVVDVVLQRDSATYSILSDFSLPGRKTVSVFLSKDLDLYLEDGDAILVSADKANKVNAMLAYEGGSGSGPSSSSSSSATSSSSSSSVASSSSSSVVSSSSSLCVPSNLNGYHLVGQVSPSSNAFNENPLACDTGQVQVSINGTTVQTLSLSPDPMRSNPILYGPFQVTLPSGIVPANGNYVFSITGTGVNCDAGTGWFVSLFLPGEGPGDTPLFHDGAEDGNSNVPSGGSFNIQTTFGC